MNLKLSVLIGRKPVKVGTAIMSEVILLVSKEREKSG